MPSAGIRARTPAAASGERGARESGDAGETARDAAKRRLFFWFGSVGECEEWRWRRARARLGRRTDARANGDGMGRRDYIDRSMRVCTQSWSARYGTRCDDVRVRAARR